MTDLKITTLTLKEMCAARESGKSKTDLARLHQNKLADFEPEDDEDSPDATLAIRKAIAHTVALDDQ